MEALKQKRTLRSTFTRSANSLDTMLMAAQANSADIEVIYKQLFERFKNLKNWDIRILDLLQKDKCTQEDYDKEYNACELYEDKFITYKTKIKNILARKAQEVDVLRFTDPGTKFKLPNIELPTFDGNPRDWLKFWTQSEKIHDDVNIETIWLNFSISYRVLQLG
ncbi:integrase catalytic domain-containing protein [Trichonephila clavipes]|nr:integrase catalytic domain-containing protein [Trichonephila clavipes]